MDLFGKKHKTGGRAAKPGTAAASRRNASRKKQDADKVEKLRARNLPRKRKPAGSPPSASGGQRITVPAASSSRVSKLQAQLRQLEARAHFRL